MTFNPDDTLQLRPCALCGKVECVYKALCALCLAKLNSGNSLAALQDAIFGKAAQIQSMNVLYRDEHIEIGIAQEPHCEDQVIQEDGMERLVFNRCDQCGLWSNCYNGLCYTCRCKKSHQFQTSDVTSDVAALKQEGFLPEQISRLVALKGEEEYSPEQRRLEFYRWLYRQGRLQS